jgi:hypothetical protein
MSLNSGDKVRVIAGPYTGWDGEVLRVDGDLQLVTVVIAIFGRSAAIEFRSSQIGPYDDGRTLYAGNPFAVRSRRAVRVLEVWPPGQRFSRQHRRT